MSESLVWARWGWALPARCCVRVFGSMPAICAALCCRVSTQKTVSRARTRRIWAHSAKSVITLVVNVAQTEVVLFGETAAIETMKPGGVVIASATVPPEFAVSLAQRIGAVGLQMLDAPVSGGAARAASGEVTMMTSGPAAAYGACEDVLAAIAAKVYRLGAAHGIGSKVKITNQLLAGVHIAAAAEAMAIGLREGVDSEALYEVITHSAGNSWMFENRVPHILKGE
jgi:putative dehydrogenase